MKRRLTAIAAALGLAIIVIGLPLLLIATHNVAAPRLGWSVQALWQALLSPDDGTLLVTVVKIVGWLSWAVLTVSIAVEIVSRLRHIPVPQLRGLAWPQLLARGLVTAVLAGFLAVNNVNDLATGAAASPPVPTAGAPAAAAPLHAPNRNPASTHTATPSNAATPCPRSPWTNSATATPTRASTTHRNAPSNPTAASSPTPT